MTVPNELMTGGPYSGNGVNTTFEFDFKTFLATDVDLVHQDSGGVETPLTNGIDYTVALNADQNNDPGGVITYPAATSTLAILPTGEKLAANHDPTFTQGADLLQGGAYDPAVVEDALDRCTILANKAHTLASRAIIIPLSDGTMDLELPTVDNRKGKALIFDTVTGAPTVGTPTTQTLIGYDDTDTSGTKDRLVDNLRMNDLSQLQLKYLHLKANRSQDKYGFYRKEIWDLNNITSWTTLRVLTPNLTPNGFLGFISILLMGHTSSIGDGVIRDEYAIRAAGAITQERTLETGANLPQFRITEASEVLTIQVQSSNGTNSMSGMADLEIWFPRDFAGGGPTEWTIT